MTDNIGPRGYVIMKKSDGTILFEKDNMILTEGRKYLRELFIVNALPSDFNYTIQYLGIESQYSLRSIAFGSSGIASQLNMTTLQNPIYINGDTFKIPIQKEMVEASNGQMFIVIKGSLTPNAGRIIKELGLFLGNGTLVEDKLFSRVVFDPIPVEEGETYDIDYYIYF
jgi:hypothetical protein